MMCHLIGRRSRSGNRTRRLGCFCHRHVCRSVGSMIGVGQQCCSPPALIRKIGSDVLSWVTLAPSLESPSAKSATSWVISNTLSRLRRDSVMFSAVRLALQRDARFPASVFGPVLLSALRRLASICRYEVIGSCFRFAVLTQPHRIRLAMDVLAKGCEQFR
jgi:hypothetical protein